MKRLLASATILSLLAATPMIAQAPPGSAAPSPASFPDTPLGRLGHELLDLVNEGDSASIRAFLARAGATQFDRGRTPAWYAHTLAKLHAQSGGLTVMRTRVLPNGHTLRILTRAQRVDRWLGIEVVTATDDSMRIASLMTIALDDPTKPPAPWPTGLATDADVASAIRDHVRQAAADDRFSGVVLVAKGDSIVVQEALGMADREHSVANTRETRFNTTSVGKMFTAVAIAQLVEQGKLHFNDTLVKVLPEYPNREEAKRITIAELLTHTAGVPDVFSAPRFTARHDFRSHIGMLSTFADAPLDFAPGTRFQYSNGGYATLGAVIEKLSGQSYEAYLHEHVWKPAGMRHTDHAGQPRGPGRAIGYARFSDTDPLGIEPRRPNTGEFGDIGHGGDLLAAFGGGSYTAEDLFRFTRALRNGKLLRPETVAVITRGAVSLGDGSPAKYAYGFYDVSRGGHRVVSHPGSNSDTGLDADVEMLWDNDWTVVVLSNYDAPAGIGVAGEIVQVLMGR